MPIMAQNLQPIELLSILSKISQNAVGQHSITKASNWVMEALTNELGFLSASLLLISSSERENIIQGELVTYGPHGLEREEVQFPSDPTSLPGWIMKNQKSRVITDFQNELSILGETASEARSEIGIPLLFNNNFKGILFFFSTESEGFPAHLVSALESFTTLFATTLENLEKIGFVEENLRQSSTLKQFSQNILLAKNAEDVIQYLLSGLATTSYLTGVYSVEKDHLAVLGINDPYAPHTKASFEGIALPLHDIANILPKDDVLYIEDLTEALEFRNLASFYSRNEYRSTALFSIYENEQLSKIVVISAQSPNQLAKEDLAIFDELIKATRRSLSQFKESKLLRRQVEELSTLQKVTKAVSAETNLDSLYRILHEQIIQSIGSDVGFLVTTLDPQTNMIQVPYLFEDGKLQHFEPFPLGEGLTSILLKNKEPLLVNENTRERFKALGAKFLGEPSRSWLGVPLLIENEAIGAIIVQDMRREKRFSENDLNLLITIAPHVALALRNAQTFTRMQAALTALDLESYLLNSLLDNIPEKVYFLDKEGQFLKVSQSYASSLGQSDTAALIGKSSMSFSQDSDTQQKSYKQDEQILQSGKAKIGTVEHDYDRQGNPHWTINSRIPLFDSQKNINGLLSLSQNIDELKETEQLAQERAQRLQIAAEIASEASRILSVEHIYNKVVNLVRDRFGYYHASVFQIDPLGEYAILQEAAGEIGAEMKKIGHKLAVGSKSLVGQATKFGVPVVIDDVTKDRNYYPNPLLPDTRSEMVLPIKIGERIIGALDVQSTTKNAFSPEVVETLQILSDQLATATSNALLLTTTQKNLQKNSALNKVATSAAASPSIEEALKLTTAGLQYAFGDVNVAVFLLNAIGVLEFRSAAGFAGQKLASLTIENDDFPLGQNFAKNTPLLISDIRTVKDPNTISDSTQSLIAIPFQFSNEPLGMLCVESSSLAAFDQTDLETLINFSNMLAAIVFNNKLLDQLRRQADKQRAIVEITNKVRQTAEMQSILHTSVAEICKAVGASRARIEITSPKEVDTNRSSATPEIGQEVRQ